MVPFFNHILVLAPALSLERVVLAIYIPFNVLLYNYSCLVTKNRHLFHVSTWLEPRFYPHKSP
jgi:hypothetical protein